MRTVVLLCGPPGAGKTTAARASGLLVFDRDDPQWSGEADFVEALRALGRQAQARAVVIRSGSTSTARAKAAALVGATHVFLVTAPRDELVRRVRRRGRVDLVQSIAGVDRWFERHDRADGIRDFPGWAVALSPPSLGVTSHDW